MSFCRKTLLAAALASVFGCSETPPPPPAASPPVASPALPEPPPVALIDAPKASGSLTMIPASDVKALLAQPLDASPAAADLVRRDADNEIAARCAPIGARLGKAHPVAAKSDEVEAEPLKIGMIPTAIPPALANQLTEKTRVWQVMSDEFDFYQTLSDHHAAGLTRGMAAVSCIRFSLFRPELYADMLFSVTHNPKKPEILTLSPIRVFYRDFASLADQPGSTQAAIKVTLDMRSYSLDRSNGRVASAQNQEFLVELFTDPGEGRPIYQLYDPARGATVTIALPPWDFSEKSIDPQHNLAMLNLNVTEIADFDWLQSQAHILWPGWEREATDAYKLKRSAADYRHLHASAVDIP